MANGVKVDEKERENQFKGINKKYQGLPF